jgi:hypothetical protein
MVAMIVYAIHSYDSHWQNESDREIRSGELLDVAGADAECVGDAKAITDAIFRVAVEIEGRMPENAQWSTGVFPRLAHECTADLPAEEI